VLNKILGILFVSTQDFLFWQEPWLLHKFDDDFYGEELRLVIVGYIRPEVVQKLMSISNCII